MARTCTPENHIGVIGTKVTIKSRAYDDFIHRLSPALTIHSTACPAFVPLIEEGIIENEIMDLTIRYYMDSFISYHRIDTLVLGCTHYPLILENLRRLYPGLRIINPSEEIVGCMKSRLEEHNLFAEDEPAVENVFYASDLSENFVNMINRIFENTGFTVAFKNFDMDEGRQL